MRTDRKKERSVSQPGFNLPPIQKTEHDEVRKVGFELEFTGIDLDQTATIIRDLFGGHHLKEHRF